MKLEISGLKQFDIFFYLRSLLILSISIGEVPYESDKT